MVLGKLNLSNSSSNPRFGIRIDMVNRDTNNVLHFGEIAKLLPFFASAGIKFIELGNLNSFDYQTGRHSSVFAKEPRLIPPEYLEQNFPDLNYVPSITQIKHILYDLISGGSSVFLPELIDFEKFNSSWLQDYACFAALSEYIGNNKFNEWPTDIRKYDRHAIKTIHHQLSDN
ncbi:MAG: 4-alpha-glucanotransferase, partial [Opitutales bacterium]|nr:4-alpha-glucanotransferase [Opitutales bacterium]